MKQILSIIVLFVALTAQAINPPYSNDFSSNALFKACTVIDANGDGKTFKYYELLNQETGESDGCARNESPANGCDDWLILPAIALKAGTYYDFSADIRAWSDKWAETFEIYVGKKASVADMTAKLMEATTIKHNTYRRYTAGFMPEKSGNYYFAIRHCNQSEGFDILIDNVAVKVASSGVAPAAPDEILITPDYGGALKADITFTTPTKSISGDDITSLTKAEIWRDGEVVHTIDNPELGKEYTFIDEGMTEGYHEYAASVSNEVGTSPKVSATRWCGIPQPAAPASCRIVETEIPGMVTMTWEPVTTDVDGYDLNPDLITYVVAAVKNGEVVLVSGYLKGTTYTFDALSEGEDIGVAYGGVYAYTNQYSKTAPGSNTMIVGKSYDLPYAESYANAQPTYIFAAARTAGNGGEWGLYASASDGMEPQDGDGGFAACKIGYKESSSKLMLGKFNMPEDEAATLSFWYYPYVEEGQAANTVDVWVTDSNNERHTVATVEQSGPVRVWRQATIDLGEFKGQNVRIELNVTCVSITYTMIDNITIATPEDAIQAVAPETDDARIYNLQGVRLAAPQRGLNIINGKKVVR